MLAITFDDFKKYGCPNCGCDYAISGPISGGGSSFGTCKHCNLRFEIRCDADTVPSWKTGVRPINPVDPDSDYVMESGFLLNPHPRTGVAKWHWEPADEKPKDGGEFWKPRGIGYDLSGFVKTRYAGQRIDYMVKKVLNKQETKSWLDYREHEPLWIQYKVSPDEFNLERLYELTKETGIITEDILVECRL